MPPTPAGQPSQTNAPALRIYLSFRADRNCVSQGDLGDAFIRFLENERFAPGKAKNVYSSEINFSKRLPKGSVSLDVKHDNSAWERLGLSVSFNGDALRIAGTPAAGFDAEIEYVVDARYARLGANGRLENVCTDETEPWNVRVPFFIAPDPWEAWEEHDPPKDALYPTPHEARQIEEIRAENPKYCIAASLRGRSHAHRGKFRDDNFQISIGAPNGWNVFAVADGAGSAEFSREGSRLACEGMIRRLNEYLQKTELTEKIDQKIDEITRNLQNLDISREEEFKLLRETQLNKIFHNAIHSVYVEILDEAKRIGRRLNDFHTTLLVVALKKFPQFWALASYWIGDGIVAVYRPNGADRIVSLGTPDSGKFAGETRFLTMPEEIAAEPIKNRLHFALLRDFTGVVMATDGITDPFFSSEADLVNFGQWKVFWEETIPREFPRLADARNADEASQAFLDGLKFKVEGNHDDRTLVLITGQKEIEEFRDRASALRPRAETPTANQTPSTGISSKPCEKKTRWFNVALSSVCAFFSSSKSRAKKSPTETQSAMSEPDAVRNQTNQNPPAQDSRAITRNASSVKDSINSQNSTKES